MDDELKELAKALVELDDKANDKRKDEDEYIGTYTDTQEDFDLEIKIQNHKNYIEE